MILLVVWRYAGEDGTADECAACRHGDDCVDGDECVARAGLCAWDACGVR